MRLARAMLDAIRSASLVGLTAALAACGADRSRAGSTPVAEGPVAPPGSPSCALDAALPLDRRAVVVLEEGRDTDAAARRWSIDAYGVLELDGYDSIEAVVPPETADGAALARSLRGQLEDSGVLELPDGCYGAPDPDGWSTRVTTLVIPAGGRVHRYALVGGDGPPPLRRAVRLVHAYGRAIALPHGADARELVAELTPPAPR